MRCEGVLRQSKINTFLEVQGKSVSIKMSGNLYETPTKSFTMKLLIDFCWSVIEIFVHKDVHGFPCDSKQIFRQLRCSTISLEPERKLCSTKMVIVFFGARKKFIDIQDAHPFP